MYRGEVRSTTRDDYETNTWDGRVERAETDELVKTKGKKIEREEGNLV